MILTSQRLGIVFVMLLDLGICFVLDLGIFFEVGDLHWHFDFVLPSCAFSSVKDTTYLKLNFKSQRKSTLTKIKILIYVHALFNQ